MATIKARKQANGTIRYTAVVRMRRGTTVLRQESKTFAHRSAALSWPCCQLSIFALSNALK